LDKVRYKKTDDFINELFLYNFHVNQIYNISNSDIKKYVRQGSADRNDYIISGNVDIVKTDSNYTVNLTVKATNDGNKEYFNKVYHYKNLNIDDIYLDVGKYTRLITLGLLDDDEQKKVCQVNVDSYYGKDSLYLNNFYLGEGNHPNLVLPVDSYEVKTVFYKNWLKKTVIDANRFQVNKIKQPLFKFSLGMTITSRLVMHPLYNTGNKIALGSTEYNLSDFYENANVKVDYNNFLSTQNGIGIDFTMEHKYFAISYLTSVIIGECFRTKTINSTDSFSIGSDNITDFQSKLQLGRLSVITDINIMPYALFLKPDSPVRLYLGIGFYNSLWYNNMYYEKVYGVGTVGVVSSKFKTENYNKNSLFYVMGLSPEFGVIYKFMKFNLKVGLAYNFDLYKYLFYSTIKDTIFDTFNTGNVAVKIGVGYYIN
jgi:hypothetical protein